MPQIQDKVDQNRGAAYLFLLLFIRLSLGGSLCLLLTSCPEPPDEQIDTTISLSLDYSGLREMWLKVSVEDPSSGWTFLLERDGEGVMTVSVEEEDTVVVDTGVEVSSDYSYQAYRLMGGEAVDSSTVLQAVTMDTTSHDFTFEIDTLGESGVLWDVWAFDENNVWVVGEILPVASETWNVYNAAHWDGSEWELIRIAPPDAPPAYPHNAIHSFSTDDIWTATSAVYHWDGSEWGVFGTDNSTWEFDGYVRSIWGTSSSNLFFVGDNGCIVHYNGSSFMKMMSGTDINLLDVTGVVDEETGQVRVWAGGYSPVGRGVLVAYEQDSWTGVWNKDNPFYPNEQYLDVGGVWAPDTRSLLLNAGGYTDELIVRHNQNNFDDYEILFTNSTGFTRGLHGNGLNDFFAVGDDHVIHYNGQSTRIYEEVSDDVRLLGVKQTENRVFIVGEVLFASDHLIAIRGLR